MMRRPKKKKKRKEDIPPMGVIRKQEFSLLSAIRNSIAQLNVKL